MARLGPALGAEPRTRAPVVAFFSERGLVHHVDGTIPIEQVSDAILAELDVPRA